MNSKRQSFSNRTRWRGKQRRIGITGGIASGKSSVGNYLQKTKGIPIIDADIYGRECLSPGKKATKKVLLRYGDSVINSSNNNGLSINRSVLSKIIFNNKDERLWLEKLVHPYVVKRMRQEIELYKKCETLILIIPLLFEAKLTSLCSEIWVVNCSQKQQLDRLVLRNKITQKEANKIIKAQWPLKIKTNLADVIIDNTNESNQWKDQIELLF